MKPHYIPSTPESDWIRPGCAQMQHPLTAAHLLCSNNQCNWIYYLQLWLMWCSPLYECWSRMLDEKHWETETTSKSVQTTFIFAKYSCCRMTHLHLKVTSVNLTLLECFHATYTLYSVINPKECFNYLLHYSYCQEPTNTIHTKRTVMVVPTYPLVRIWFD